MKENGAEKNWISNHNLEILIIWTNFVDIIIGNVEIKRFHSPFGAF